MKAYLQLMNDTKTSAGERRIMSFQSLPTPLSLKSHTVERRAALRSTLSSALDRRHRDSSEAFDSTTADLLSQPTAFLQRECQ